LTYLCTYDFIISQVPHVFRDSYFARLINEYSGKYIKRCIPTRRNEELRKGIIKRPIYHDNLGEVPPKEWPIPSQWLTMRRRWLAEPARLRLHPSTASRPHLHHGSSINAPRTVACGTSSKYAPQPPLALV
jgi:hypothetical protein